MAKDPLNFPLYDRYKSMFEVWSGALTNTADIWNESYKRLKRSGDKIDPSEVFGRWIQDMMRTHELNLDAIASTTRLALVGADDTSGPKWITFNLRDDPAKDDRARDQTAGVYIRPLDLDSAAGGELKASLLTPMGQGGGCFKVSLSKTDVAGLSYTVTLSEFAPDGYKFHPLGKKGIASLKELKARVLEAAEHAMKIRGGGPLDPREFRAEYIGFLYASGEGGGAPRAVVFATV